MTSITMADARARLREILDDVTQTHERYTITRNGHSDAVLIAVTDLEAMEETVEILSEPETLAAIREGLMELERGERSSLADIRRELGL